MSLGESLWGVTCTSSKFVGASEVDFSILGVWESVVLLVGANYFVDTVVSLPSGNLTWA